MTVVHSDRKQWKIWKIMETSACSYTGLETVDKKNIRGRIHKGDNEVLEN